MKLLHLQNLFSLLGQLLFNPFLVAYPGLDLPTNNSIKLCLDLIFLRIIKMVPYFLNVFIHETLTSYWDTLTVNVLLYQWLLLAWRKSLQLSTVLLYKLIWFLLCISKTKILGFYECLCMYATSSLLQKMLVVRRGYAAILYVSNSYSIYFLHIHYHNLFSQ